MRDPLFVRVLQGRGDLLPDVMDQYPDEAGSNALWQVAVRLIALPAYVGYLNPMEPEDTPKFWEALWEE